MAAHARGTCRKRELRHPAAQGEPVTSLSTLGSYVKTMNEDKNRTGDTIRIQRPPPRVFTDPLGHNIWMGDVVPPVLEVQHSDDNTDPYNRALTAADVWARARPG